MNTMTRSNTTTWSDGAMAEYQAVMQTEFAMRKATVNFAATIKWTTDRYLDGLLTAEEYRFAIDALTAENDYQN